MAYKSWYAKLLDNCNIRVLRVIITLLVVVWYIPSWVYTVVVEVVENVAPEIRQEIIKSWNWKSTEPKED